MNAIEEEVEDESPRNEEFFLEPIFTHDGRFVLSESQE